MRASLVIQHMWAGGRPSNTGEYAAIFAAAVKAGLDENQAFSLACIAFDANKGYVERLSVSVRGIRRATLARKAADHTSLSLWRWLLEKFGAGYYFLTDEEIFREHNDNFAEWSQWSKDRVAAREYVQDTIFTVGVPAL